MYIEEYLSEVEGEPVSEIALYTPLALHVFRKLLNYPARNVLINKRNEAGIPDVRVVSVGDGSEWVVCEAKLRDAEIRNEASRQRIWSEQIVGRRYIGAETAYVVLCAPYTFQVFLPTGEMLGGAELDPERRILIDLTTREERTLDDAAVKAALRMISAQASEEMPQYAPFRRGELAGGYIPLSQDTVGQLRPVFEFGLRELRAYCKEVFDALKDDYATAVQRRVEVAAQLELAGDDPQMQSRVRNRERAVKRNHRISIQLFEEDYPQFKHDQAYANTKEEAHFEEIFLTNTAYIALTRMFFVRICEDIGLTTRKVSNEGPGLWGRFVEHIKHQYKDLLEVAFQDARHVYSRLFESTVFDWYGEGNGRLNAILERILLRLNAFSFSSVDRDLLGTVYQYFRPRTERKRLGEYYTPEPVVDYILWRVGITVDPNLMQRRILDPACGSFTFGVRATTPLLKAGRHLTAQNKLALVQRTLAGRDINPFSVFLSHLSLLFTTLDIYRQAKQDNPAFEIPGFDVANINSLAAETWQYEMAGEDAARGAAIAAGTFDYVVGNPPFVRNERLPEEDREALEAAFGYLRAGNTDLATYFLDSAMTTWLKEDGRLGMVAPIGQANSKNAAVLRQRLAGYTIEEVVSLEWMAKEAFPDADIISMLLFVRKASPPPGHRVTVVTGLRSKAELERAAENEAFRAEHASEIDFQDWLTASPTSDWPLDVTARDIPILKKLSDGPRLGSSAHASYAIKPGRASGSVAIPIGQQPTKPTVVPFAMGQQVCAFGISEPDEMIDLDIIGDVADKSIWRDLGFYRANQGRKNDGGFDANPFPSGALLAGDSPSDTLCCFVPNIYTTLVGAVVDPLQIAANNSVMVVVPQSCSAHQLAAVINSRIARYYAFLTMRAAILLRRRCNWYPRTINNLPWPKLDATSALRIHGLAEEAASLSAGAQRTEAGMFAEGMRAAGEKVEAGYLGVYLEGAPSIDKDDLAAAMPDGPAMRVGDAALHASDSDTLVLARVAALAGDVDEITNQHVQSLLLPADPARRAHLAAAIRALEGEAEAAKAGMEAICEEIDALVASGLGLTLAEHDVIKARCSEFPLSVTVGRPRYVWNPDRKTQARRIYDRGQRFRI